jgi:YidC/Oxa1 family membrane protein insertase
MKDKAFQNILKNILTFLVIFLVVNFIFSFFTGGTQKDDTLKGGDYGFMMKKKDFPMHDAVLAEIRNNTDKTLTIADQCPKAPIRIYEKSNGEWTEIQYQTKIKCPGKNDLIIEPNQKKQLDLTAWTNGLFGKLGTYKLAFDMNSKTYESDEFEITNQTFFGWAWQTICYQPIYNSLIFLISIIPGHDLGWAIILLTILIRTILLIPSQRALKSQRKLQEIQPLLQDLKEQYKDDQQRMAQETLALHKKYKVNPFGSCLPLIIQLPILIALFYVIQNGLNPETTYLLYNGLAKFDLNLIGTKFLEILELTEINFYVLPILVGLLQYIQMKLSFAKSKKSTATKKQGSEMEMANKTMGVIMPIMIALFTASVPAGVGLYWCFSTLFGIGQQLVVNGQPSGTGTTIEVVEPNKPVKESKKDKNDKIVKIKI